MTDTEMREELVAAAERDEQELKAALADLKRAVHSPFDVREVGERIGGSPVPWLLGSLLFGLWLGSRS